MNYDYQFLEIAVDSRSPFVDVSMMGSCVVARGRCSAELSVFRTYNMAADDLFITFTAVPSSVKIVLSFIIALFLSDVYVRASHAGSAAVGNPGFIRPVREHKTRLLIA